MTSTEACALAIDHGESDLADCISMDQKLAEAAGKIQRIERKRAETRALRRREAAVAVQRVIPGPGGHDVSPPNGPAILRRP